MVGRSIHRTMTSSAILLVLCTLGSEYTFASELHRFGIVQQQPQPPPQPQSPFGVSEMAWALRWTCELNRQLVQSTRTSSRSLSPSESSLNHKNEAGEASSSPSLLLRGGSHDQDDKGSIALQIPQQEEEEKDPLSIFHASSPANRQETAAARWGPNLASFLQRALHVVGVVAPKDQERILLLALLYMDRASSVATPRSQAPTCCALPYCLPRTVHRLSLAAILLAAAASSCNLMTIHQGCERIAVAFNMCPQQVEAMVWEMKQALGDFGALVTPSQYQQFQQTWRSSPVLQQLMENQRHEELAAPVVVEQ